MDGPSNKVMSVRTTTMSSGEKLVLLAPSLRGMPDTWVAGYAITALRSRRLAVTTTQNIMKGIARGLDFCRARGIGDLHAFLLDNTFGDDALVELVERCGARRGGGPPVCKAGAHYRAFVDYTLWLHDQPGARPRDEAARLVARLDLAARAAAVAPPDGEQGSGPRRLGLTVEQRDLFLRAIVPGGATNPFRATAFRNFVTFSLAFCLGLRSGELRGLKIEHLDLRGRIGRLKVVRNQTDDPEDRRAEPAAQKTKARAVNLSPRLTVALRTLIDERETLARSHDHSFLLVNRDGEPLGGRGLRKAYETLRAANPELAELINHQLRHDWNDRWNELVKEKGWDLSECLDHQIHAMGWVFGSTMPQRYGRRSRERLADDRLMTMQERSERRTS